MIPDNSFSAALEQQKKIPAQIIDGDRVPFVGKAVCDKDHGVFWPKDAANLDVLLDRKITLKMSDRSDAICIALRRRPEACCLHYHFLIIDERRA
ncbi:MAG: hypothetical protein V1746_04200 [bacterium]